ncbi:MAG: peptidoglycan DD-metalloendopeptidase family protein [Gammaproteobacteria bacterium]|nr:peptidoglycan DD-metalloendopeptidase family protein [Gammaproteobacteria bacterium]
MDGLSGRVHADPVQGLYDRRGHRRDVVRPVRFRLHHRSRRTFLSRHGVDPSRRRQDAGRASTAYRHPRLDLRGPGGGSLFLSAVRYRTGIVIVLFLTALIQGCGRPPFHIVRPGETLYSISWRYDQDFHDLASWNELQPPYALKPGQAIVLSSDGRAGADTGQRAVAAPSSPTPTTNPGATNPRPAAKPSSARTYIPVPVTQVAPSNVRPDWRWPVRGKLVHAFDAQSKGIEGRGLDIAGRDGDPVRSAAAGQVVYSGSGIPSYGNLLIIKHNERYLSAYAYNRRLLVREGDVVRDGQIIAEMGSSGIASTQAMLHFEIRLNGKPVDPRRLLP